MMKYKPYSEYKDSGIQWIGEIPEGWEVRKVKYFSFSVAGGTPDTNNISYWDGEIPWLPSGMIHDNSLHEKDVKTFITFEGLNNSSAKWIKNDSVLVALTGATCANIAYLTFKATANQSVIGIECDNKTFPKYIFYYLLSQREQILLNQTGGAQAGINKKDVKNLICAYPDNQDQTAIANFLDKKTAKIDVLIEKDKRLIALLKEKRTALINHAVTKGLDPNAKMKKAGVEWIREVPEGWSCAKLKHLTKLIIDGTHFTPEYLAEGIPFLRVTDIQSDKINFDDIKFISKEEHKELNYRCNPKKGDLLLSKNGTVGIPKVIDWDYSFSIFVSLCLIKLNNKLYVNYLKYSILTRCIKEQILYRSKTTSVTNLHLDQIKEFIIAYPQRPEQLKIVDYLDKATAKIDKTIQKIEKKIKLLEEYKKSLIHHTVTGKIDVREVKI